MPIPPGTPLRRDGRFPALCTDGGRFLAHLGVAASRRSPKIEALLADLRSVLPRDGKALVFSQLKVWAYIVMTYAIMGYAGMV